MARTVVIAFSICLFLGGVFCLAIFLPTLRPWYYAKAQPQTLTCQELNNSGPGGNYHVVLTEFDVSPKFMTKGAIGVTEFKWRKAWVPLYPKGDAGEHRAITVLLATENARTKDSLDDLADAGQIRGLICRDAASVLTDEEKRMLAEDFPETDFSKCWVLEHEASPPALSIFLPLGLSLLPAALVLFIVGYRWMRRQRPTAANGPV